MQLGRFTIEPLNEGRFEFFRDGKINRRPVSTSVETLSEYDESLVGINPLYITDGSHHILLDTGLGWGLDAGSSYKDISNICSNLEIFGIKPEDITHVVLTHLHYDHAAGLSYTNKDAATCPTFPNATCYVQHAEWDFAVEQAQHDSAASQFYKLDDLYRLYADNFFKLVDGYKTEVVPGIELIKTGGHTPGHQVVKITDQEQSAYFWGDMLPSSNQLNHYDVSAGHINRMQTKKMKVQLIRQAYEENAILHFYHSLSAKPGRLRINKDQNFVLEELE